MGLSTFPDEIIADVLSRLPVKALMRFRCVCKSWRFLISNPQFIKLHLNQAIRDVNSSSCKRVLLSSYPLQSIDYEARNNGVDDDPFTVLNFLTMVPNFQIEIAGSCNGLVCLVIDRNNIIVCNPSTRDFKELPKAIITSSDGYIANGLGYDSSVDDYKVVRATRTTLGNFSSTQVEIFSLRTNSWRRIQDNHHSITLDGRGTFSNGALHWLVSGETGQVIVSFELATEEFKEVAVPLPDQGDTNLSFGNLYALGGCLAITRSYCGHHEVWVMKEYSIKAPWTKLFAIAVDDYAPHYRYWMLPICLSKNGEVLMDVDRRELVMYNPAERTFRDLDIQVDWGWFEPEVAEYVESLVSPYGNGENN